MSVLDGGGAHDPLDPGLADPADLLEPDGAADGSPFARPAFLNRSPKPYADPALHELLESTHRAGMGGPLYLTPAGRDRFHVYGSDLPLADDLIVVARRGEAAPDPHDLLLSRLRAGTLDPVAETRGVMAVLARSLDTDEPGVRSLLHRLHKEVKGSRPRRELGGERARALEETLAGLGRARVTWQTLLTDRLPLLRLPEDVAAALRDGRLSRAAALEVGRVADESERRALLERAAAEPLTRAEARRVVSPPAPWSPECAPEEAPPRVRLLPDLAALGLRLGPGEDRGAEGEAAAWAEVTAEVGRWGEAYALACIERRYREAYPSAALEREPDGFTLRDAGGGVVARARWLNASGEKGHACDIVVVEAGNSYLIEVKSTREEGRRACRMSRAQWELARRAGERHVLYRVTGAGTARARGGCRDSCVRGGSD